MALIRKRLLTRRFHLLHRYQEELARVDEELEPHTANDIERASEQWDVRVLSSLSDSDARALTELVEAIHRLDKGCYGLCVSCHCRIERARLEVLPATPLCIECARDNESSDREWPAATGAPSANRARTASPSR